MHRYCSVSMSQGVKGRAVGLGCPEDGQEDDVGSVNYNGVKLL